MWSLAKIGLGDKKKCSEETDRTEFYPLIILLSKDLRGRLETRAGTGQWIWWLVIYMPTAKTVTSFWSWRPTTLLFIMPTIRCNAHHILVLFLHIFLFYLQRKRCALGWSEILAWHDQRTYHLIMELSIELDNLM